MAENDEHEPLTDPMDYMGVMDAMREVIESWDKCLMVIAGLSGHGKKFAMLSLVGTLSLRFQAVLTISEQMSEIIANEDVKNIVPPPETPGQVAGFGIIADTCKDIIKSLAEVREHPDNHTELVEGFMTRQRERLDKLINHTGESLTEKPTEPKPHPWSNPSMN